MISRDKIMVSIALVVLVVAGIYIYRLVYGPVTAKPDAEIVALKQEIEALKGQVQQDRVIIKEVIRDAKQNAIQYIAVLSDDAVADEINARLSEYRKRRGKAGE